MRDHVDAGELLTATSAPRVSPRMITAGVRAGSTSIETAPSGDGAGRSAAAGAASATVVTRASVATVGMRTRSVSATRAAGCVGSAGGPRFETVSMLYLAMTAASAGAFWWLHLRADRSVRRAAAQAFDEDAGIAVHVARHEAETRRQVPSTAHVLYGLLQVEAVAAAIGDAGGDAAALEDDVLAAMAAGGRGELEALDATLRRAEHSARGASRRIGCADLWAYLGDGRAAAVLAKAQVDRAAVLFRLAHGAGPPALPGSDRGTAMVELRDDPYTTKDFVVTALREGLGLDAAEAERIMEAVHTTGHGTIGPMAMATARTAVITMRDLAQRSQFPLWVGVTAASS